MTPHHHVISPCHATLCHIATSFQIIISWKLCCICHPPFFSLVMSLQCPWYLSPYHPFDMVLSSLDSPFSPNLSYLESSFNLIFPCFSPVFPSWVKGLVPHQKLYRASWGVKVVVCFWEGSCHSMVRNKGWGWVEAQTCS